MKFIYIGTLALLLTSCGVDEDKAIKALESQGMTNIKITGFAIFGCSKDDSFRSNFTATGVNGKTVSGTLCSGFLKGTTVRFY